MEETIELRSKYQYFRVLVMGRANAGKTTILKAVCGTTEAPQVYNKRGRRIQAKKSILLPTSRRGVHNIENELRFRSNPGFVFHDSCGFEAGATEELEMVRAFINSRATERSVHKQLHAIWFCLPTDHDARMLTAAELDFFDRCNTGKVPVIAVFTKFDSLDSKAFQELRDRGIDFFEARERAPHYADEHFERIHLNRVFQRQYPPANELRIRNMHEGDKCGELIRHTVAELLRKTSDALDTDALRLLLTTVQNNNIELCTVNAINSGHITAAAQEAFKSGFFLSGKKFKQFLWNAGVQYPYLWYQEKEFVSTKHASLSYDTSFLHWQLDCELPLLRNVGAKTMDILRTIGLAGKFEALISRRPFTFLRDLIDMVEFDDGSLSQFLDDIAAWLVAFCPKINGDLPPPLQVLNFGACSVICCAALCWKKIGKIGAKDFQKCFEHYEQSGIGDHVRVAIREKFDDVGPYNTMEQKAKLLQIVLDNSIDHVPE